ncbi:hypothetical protein H5P28_15830 [Ruficoccus amylovorans]|uniref:SGNH hydrolase-type esterase domain-containing protein n=1 Tax=Ruficoccus amylovorans TaxID=1804625 RepID=A0A842HJS6_9BACT|nr:GDSL-type esterase/lipase family protein [Ruficoccus amylovorans]MBC2595737.1 hypothetical protein [Ruficoccus amylovorans]
MKINKMFLRAQLVSRLRHSGWCLFAGLVALACNAGAQTPYRSPERWEGWIASYEKQDAANPPPKGAIVCLGSSSMVGWHELIGFDLAPLTLVTRGFGGSNTNDALTYADRIVLPLAPRAIVFYEGENDIAEGVSPQLVAETFDRFVDKVHAQYPQCRFYVLSLKPSPLRQALWPKMEATNAFLQERCAADPLLTYVDVSAGMFNDDGSLKADIFQSDRLHMNRKGYVGWRETLLPVLLESELAYESSAN